MIRRVVPQPTELQRIGDQINVALIPGAGGLHKRATKLVFGAISGILKANRDKILTVDQINEIFAEMRRVTDWLQQKANGASASLDLSSASALNRPTLRTP
jgi:hypothetical protein